MPEGQFSHEMSKFREQTDSKIMILAKKKKKYFNDSHSMYLFKL